MKLASQNAAKCSLKTKLPPCGTAWSDGVPGLSRQSQPRDISVTGVDKSHLLPSGR